MVDKKVVYISNHGSATGSFVVALITSLTLVLTFGLISYYISNQNSIMVSNPDFDPNAHIYTGGEPSAPAKPGEMSISGYSKAKIPANVTSVPLLLKNPDTNAGKVYFSYDLILNDTGELLYSSKMVPPGQAITNVNLSRPLSPGEYKTTVRWKSYLIDENLKHGNNVDMALELVVE